MPDQTLASIRQFQVAHLCQEDFSLAFDGFGQQFAGTRSQDLGQGIINVVGLTKADNAGNVVHGVSLSWRGSGRLDTRLDTPPFSNRHHLDSRLAPGGDGQDFAEIEAYGVERWLGELALALREETYRPNPIRRVFIPKANGKLRPLGISTLRDRVCMTAAMLVLDPIFEADLPPELYAYRPGRNAQQAVIEVEELLFRGHPDVVDADLADYFGSIPHAELMTQWRAGSLIGACCT
jgi:hypothetical protein